MPSLQTLVGEMAQCQQEDAVWTYLLHVLGDFLDGDSASAEKQIPVPDCTVGFVEQDVMHKVIGQINDEHLVALRNRVIEIRKMEVA